MVPGEGVFLLSELGHFLLRGTTYTRLVPLLDGRSTVDELISELRGTVSAAEVVYALELLTARGYVVSSPPTEASPAETAYWHASDTPVHRSRDRGHPVEVVTLGCVDTALVRRHLVDLGLDVVEGEVAREAPPRLVLVDDYLLGALNELNDEALRTGRPWLLAKPTGRVLWLGPWFVPGSSGCWECLAQRLRGHRRVEGFLQSRHGRSGPFPVSRGGLPSTLMTALGIVATECARYGVTGRCGALEGVVVSVDTVSLESRRHDLVRRPQCPACGDPEATARSAERPIALESHRKPAGAGAADRSVTARETFARYAHHVSPITGIVSSLESNGPEPDSPVHSFVSDHSFSLVSEDLWFLRQSLRSRSGGKGVDEVGARTGALCEAIERYSGVFRGDEPRVVARLAELGEAAIHPHDYLLFSARQYRERERWNESGSRYNWVPEPFAEDDEVEWSPLWSLTAGRRRYLPTACCYYGYATCADVRFARGDSNGCAAGNNREEALLQGFLELVERDAVACWWYNRLRRPGVDLESFGLPYVTELSRYYRSLERDLWVLDITADTGIPAFAALSRRCDKKTEDIIMGFGAHLDPRVALLRSVTELNQSLPDVYRGTPDPAADHLSSDRASVEWLNEATLAGHPFLSADPDAAPLRETDYGIVEHDDLRDDLHHCLSVAEGLGLEVLVLDQTRPDVGMDVVKVVVPGLRSFWARFAPGRLYDVPVRMGWRSRPTAESDLNPFPLFF